MKAVAVATPLLLVTAVMVFVAPANVPEAPLAGAVKTTAVPDARTGLPPEVSTVALNAVVEAVPTVMPCPLPAVTTTLSAGTPAALVSLAVPGVKLPVVALTAYEPVVALTVKGLAVATPPVLVVAVVVFVLVSAKVPEAPEDGAVKVITVPAIGTALLEPSSTVALNCVARVEPTVGVWVLPAVTTTLVAGALATLKLAEVKPVPEATTE